MSENGGRSMPGAAVTQADLDRKRAVSAARAARAQARAAARAEIPVPRAELAHLSLPQLRTYRETLVDEEDLVSYWRRILQVRLDTVRAGSGAIDSVDQLRPLLRSERLTAGRTALARLVPLDDIPPIPDLARLWDAEPDSDPVAEADLERDLTRAEAELSAYRQALHRRLDAATGELIARYRQDPRQCLQALPLQRPGGR